MSARRSDGNAGAGIIEKYWPAMRLLNKLQGLREVAQFDNWLQLMISRLVFRPSMDIYYYKGMEILVEHLGGDVNGIRTCLATPMYRKFLAKMSLPMEQISVVDLGANAGGFSLLLKAEGYKLGKLVVVELNPQTCHRLVLNLERNLIGTEVLILNEGVFSRSGWIQVDLGRGSTSDSLEKLNLGSQNANARAVKTTTLDELFEKSIGAAEVNLCKIDIVGGEWDIFFSPDCKRIFQCENLLMEIHPRKDKRREQLIERPAELDFEVMSSDEAAQVFWFKRTRPALGAQIR